MDDGTSSPWLFCSSNSCSYPPQTKRSRNKKVFYAHEKWKPYHEMPNYPQQNPKRSIIHYTYDKLGNISGSYEIEQIFAGWVGEPPRFNENLIKHNYFHGHKPESLWLGFNRKRFLCCPNQ